MFKSLELGQYNITFQEYKNGKVKVAVTDKMVFAKGDSDIETIELILTPSQFGELKGTINMVNLHE